MNAKQQKLYDDFRLALAIVILHPETPAVNRKRMKSMARRIALETGVDDLFAGMSRPAVAGKSAQIAFLELGEIVADILAEKYFPEDLQQEIALWENEIMWLLNPADAYARRAAFLRGIVREYYRVNHAAAQEAARMA